MQLCGGCHAESDEGLLTSTNSSANNVFITESHLPNWSLQNSKVIVPLERNNYFTEPETTVLKVPEQLLHKC